MVTFDHIGEQALSDPLIAPQTGISMTDRPAGAHENQCLGLAAQKSSANSCALSAPYEIESFSKRKTGGIESFLKSKSSRFQNAGWWKIKGIAESFSKWPHIVTYSCLDPRGDGE